MQDYSATGLWAEMHILDRLLHVFEGYVGTPIGDWRSRKTRDPHASAAYGALTARAVRDSAMADLKFGHYTTREPTRKNATPCTSTGEVIPFL
jgi:hypothetical protein